MFSLIERIEDYMQRRKNRHIKMAFEEMQREIIERYKAYVNEGQPYVSFNHPMTDEERLEEDAKWWAYINDLFDKKDLKSLIEIVHRTNLLNGVFGTASLVPLFEVTEIELGLFFRKMFKEQIYEQHRLISNFGKLLFCRLDNEYFNIYIVREAVKSEVGFSTFIEWLAFTLIGDVQSRVDKIVDSFNSNEGYVNTLVRQVRRKNVLRINRATEYLYGDLGLLVGRFYGLNSVYYIDGKIKQGDNPYRNPFNDDDELVDSKYLIRLPTLEDDSLRERILYELVNEQVVKAELNLSSISDIDKCNKKIKTSLIKGSLNRIADLVRIPLLLTVMESPSRLNNRMKTIFLKWFSENFNLSENFQMLLHDESDDLSEPISYAKFLRFCDIMMTVECTTYSDNRIRVISPWDTPEKEIFLDRIFYSIDGYYYIFSLLYILYREYNKN